MLYREAFKIGSVCEGMIQCTYAGIYAHPDDTRALFALQHRKVRKVMAVVAPGTDHPFSTIKEYVNLQPEDNEYLTLLDQLHHLGGGLDSDIIPGSPGDYSPEEYGGRKMWENQGFRAADWKWGSLTHVGAPFNGTIIGDDIPIVWIDQIDNENKLVPAHMSEYGLNLMKSSILGLDSERYNFDALSTFMSGYEEPYKTYYVVKRINISGDPNYEAETIVAYYPTIPTMEEFRAKYKDKEGVYEYKVFELKRKYSAVLQTILDMQPGDTVYVKPDAFCWMPTNIDNLKIDVDGRQIRMKEAYDYVNNKIKNLKTMRALTVGASVIL